ncbi:fatty acyl-CoA hydrolase precursor, medium chain-like [Glandiceps talaboti]
MMSTPLFHLAVVFLCAYLVHGFNYEGDTKVVNIPDQGDVRGRRYQVDETGDLFVNFFGRIPFAAPPVDNLRFQPPGPEPSWTEERDATYYGPACPQLGSLFYNFSLSNLPIPFPTALPIPFPPLPIGPSTNLALADILKAIIAPDLDDDIPIPEPIRDIIKEIIGNLPIDLERLREIIGTIRNISNSDISFSDILDEDCLYMNIYAPETLDPSEKFPVMAFIQGGGYEIGTAMYLYDGRILAQRKKVVVVTFNYRLGALGYLSTMDGASPGNYGMLDQVAALKWIQKNIEYFGGDKDRVTVFGESAGSSSVAMHLLSPMSEGLFQKAIQQSGSALSVFSTFVPPYDPLNGTYGLADNIGCPRTPHEDLIACLMTKDALEICYHTPPGNHDTFTFIPVVDGEGGFLPDNPRTLMEKGAFHKMPLMLGYLNDETSPLMVGWFDDPANGITLEDFRQVLWDSVVTERPYYSNNVNYEDMNNALEYANLPWEDLTDEMLLKNAYTNMIDERLFDSSIHWQARFTSKAGMDTYAYRFDHPSGIFPDWMGAIHTDDLWFTFGTPYMPDKYPFLNWTDTDRQVTDIVQDLWYNFVTEGNPTDTSVSNVEGEWEKYTKDNQRLFHIMAPTSKMLDGTVDSDAHAYWMQYDDQVVRSASREAVCECPTGEPCEDVGEPGPVDGGVLFFQHKIFMLASVLATMVTMNLMS